MVSFSPLTIIAALFLGATASPNHYPSGKDVPVYTSYPGFGETSIEARLYTQAVRIGSYIRLAGQGGWFENGDLPSNFTTQVVNSFNNIDLALKVAGSRGLKDVTSIRVNIPGTPDEVVNRTLEQIRVRGIVMKGQTPTSTSIGVGALAIPGMLIEIEADAWISD
ncbi:Endoribonuclease L-PSP/chorismate mutase-like protein [Xylogone sp. PMI_703]|nr:Endoribonuclease L-PSP/chorismate mutase-like protein [Xylogone sp. PMI_703]